MGDDEGGRGENGTAEDCYFDSCKILYIITPLVQSGLTCLYIEYVSNKSLGWFIVIQSLFDDYYFLEYIMNKIY